MDINLNAFDIPVPIDHISFALGNNKLHQLDILRLDKLHDKISGNKWSKLKYNLLHASQLGAWCIVSFGGAYSNHLHALAYAGKLFKIKTIGIVRGEAVNNPTLKDCVNWGMELHFVSRKEYSALLNNETTNHLSVILEGAYMIPEGGNNDLGRKGCAEILQHVDAEQYDIICCAVGTGATIQGIAKSYSGAIWAFSPLKNARALKQSLDQSIENCRYIDEYHFGGFGKFPKEVTTFSKWFKHNHNIELDKVYTAKMFFGIQQELIKQDVPHARILAIHTGGLQGNRSSIPAEL